MLAARLAARLRELTGAEEDWIARVHEASTPRLCHLLLARCLEPAGADEPSPLDLVRSLPLAGRDWLLLQLHTRSFGDDVIGEVRCPACETANEIRVAARDLTAPPDPAPERLDITLASGATVSARPLTAADHEHFSMLAHADRAEQDEAALARVLVHGPSPALTGEDRRAIVTAIEHTVPEPIELQLTCTACATAFTAPFDIAAFVLAEVRDHSRMLLDDVHTLASAYHWSEPDVLRLSLQRRMAYLSRIDADRDRGLVQEAPRR